jgi:hypothetical protein
MNRLGGALLTVCLVATAPVLASVPANASACTVQTQCVKVGTVYRKLDGTNAYRSTDQLIMYDRTGGQTVSPANQWGYEVAVVNGKVTAVSAYKVGMAIPAGGYVLSGHGTEADWLEANAPVGATVTLPGGTQPPPTPTPTPTPTPGPAPTGAWQGQYWNNATLTGAPVLTRTDQAINFSWASTQGAGAGLDGTQDSARWTQSINFDAADYTFTVTGDDGIRVKIDGALVIDGWKDQGPTTYSATKTMTAGAHTVVVEHYEMYGSATAQFSMTKGGGTPPPPVTGDAVNGHWSIASSSMPLRAMHVTALRNGNVLLVAGSGNDYDDFTAGSFKAAVWNPTTGGFTNLTVPEDMFCSGHVTLPDGRVLIMGGTASYAGAPAGEAFRGLRSSYIFDPANNSFTKVTNQTIEGHWYPTLTKIENGNIWSAGGYTHKAGGGPSTSIEMFDVAKAVWGTAATVPQINRYLGTYPHMFLLADGRMFYTGGHTFGNPQPGTGSFLYDWRTKNIGDVPGLRDVGLRDQAGSVLLPPAQNQTFMIAGGGSTDYGGATTSVDLIDMKQGAPAWHAGPNVPGAQGRMYLNLTTLPDRTVLASNGATGNRTGNVQAAGIYNPVSNSWTDVAADPIGRNYHSAAVLLADGRVAVFGSNPADGSYEMRISLYEPPYLFKGTRPTVTAPANATYGQQISLGVTGTVVSASLTAPSSSTHQTDTNARLVDLPITGTGGTRTATVPDNPALLPPGPYMLTVLDDKGAVSTAKWVNVR